MQLYKEIKSSGFKGKMCEWFKKSKKSELIIVFGENFSAVMGLLIALIFILLTIFTDNTFYDALGSGLIGILLIIIAIKMSIEIKSLLIGESADKEIQFKIEKILEKEKNIDRIFNIITIMLGKEIMLALKCSFKEINSVEDLCKLIDKCEDNIKKNIPEIKWIFFEPDMD